MPKVQVMSILHTPLSYLEGVDLQLHSFLTWNSMELSVQPRIMAVLHLVTYRLGVWVSIRASLEILETR